MRATNGTTEGAGFVCWEGRGFASSPSLRSPLTLLFSGYRSQFPEDKAAGGTTHPHLVPRLRLRRAKHAPPHPAPTYSFTVWCLEKDRSCLLFFSYERLFFFYGTADKPSKLAGDVTSWLLFRRWPVWHFAETPTIVTEISVVFSLPPSRFIGRCRRSLSIFLIFFIVIVTG